MIFPMREDLAAMGQKLEDTDFYAIVMGSLPTSYDPYISAVNATSSVLGKTLSADDLILTVTEEYERRTLKAKSSKKDADNAAFHSSDAGKDQKGGQKRKDDCHNCGKKGHWTRDCYAEGGGKEGQGPKQKGKGKGKGKGKDKEKDKKDDKDKDTASAAETKKDDKSKDEEAWLTVVLDDTEVVDTSESDSDDVHDDFEDDWCCEEAYSCFIDEEPFTNYAGQGLTAGNEHIHIPIDISTNYEYAYLVGTSDTRKLEVDLYDSGATRHMSGFIHKFVNFIKIDPIPITAADKRTFQAIGKGDMYVNIPNKSRTNSQILLKDVLYAPSMGVTLVSISKIASAGSTVVFTGNFCRIYNKNRVMIGEIKVKGGLYRVHYSASGVEGYSVQTNEILTVDELHRRLGHVSHERAKHLVKKGSVEGIELQAGDEATTCEPCESAKGARKAVTKVREGGRCPAVGDEIHSDLWGKAPVESINHKLYYVSFTDDHSRYTNIYLLHSKDEAFDHYRIYEAWLSTQHNAKIKCLRSDRGGEYLSEDFSAHLKQAGTVRKLTVHDTPEHNGVSERLNRTIMEKVRAMLLDSGMPKFLWAEAVTHAVYLKNRTWTRTIGNTTPYEILYGHKPNLSNLHTWGCRVRVHREVDSKLESRSFVGHWMGFDEDTKDGH